MTDPDLVERLAAHRTVGGVPRAQLGWLVSHGTLRRLEAGAQYARPGVALDELMVVLSGRLAIYVDRGSGPRRVMEWRGGDVTGLLPYSRLRNPPGHAAVEEEAEVLAVHRDHFPEMISSCHELTASLVHEMLDRARRFTKNDLHDEKLLSLGRLAAGLAHELNNPAAAVASSARELTARVLEVEGSSLALGGVTLTSEQLDAIARVRAQCCDPAVRAGLTPLERSDREEAVAAWMARHRLPGGIGEGVSESAITVESLDHLFRSLGNDALPFALRALGAVYRARVLASEIGTAADRIEKLVKSIKGFTYMDQAADPTPVQIRQGLADTIAVLGGKARRKSVILDLLVDDDLPPVEGFGGDLNQVWGNLIDNAIDAVPESGHIEVAACRRDDQVVVRVRDDGPGIPENKMSQIFEPFFTTKPQGEGTGLGLDIARRLVRQHRGRIEVSSRPGCTEFRVILPLAPSGPPAAHRSPSPGDGHAD